MTNQLSLPRARLTDPITSHEAASVVRDGNDDLVTAIRKHVWFYGSATQDEIADALAGDRWTRGTVVTGCARAGLTLVAHEKNARGRTVGVYSLAVQTLPGL